MASLLSQVRNNRIVMIIAMFVFIALAVMLLNVLTKENNYDNFTTATELLCGDVTDEECKKIIMKNMA
jgi:cytochrome c-type biogenesis protein CcmE